MHITCVILLINGGESGINAACYAVRTSDMK